MSGGYVWRDADGKVYYSWQELSTSHLENVIRRLRRNIEDSQRQFKITEKTNPEVSKVHEEAWTRWLLALEGANKELQTRGWELISPPAEFRPMKKKTENDTKEPPRKIRM